jgi:hypothetical protein
VQKVNKQGKEALTVGVIQVVQRVNAVKLYAEKGLPFLHAQLVNVSQCEKRRRNANFNIHYHFKLSN